MIFSRSSRRPTREFSLAELVAKISELEQRQRNALPSGNAPDRDRRDRPTASRSEPPEWAADAELTE